MKHQDSLSYTRYSQGFQYFDDVLQFFHTPEGYVKNTPTETGAFSFDYVYNYVDHLGNVRMSYAQDPQTGVLKIMEENHYYPFGLKHTNYAQLTKDIQREEDQSEKKISDRPPVMPLKNPGYNYKFNGMELQSEFGVNVYDFGARNYDPALGRWMNIDPLAEKMRRHSPYNYAFNNPIYFIDPDGMEAVAANSTSAASGSAGFDTVIITGSSAEQATTQLNASVQGQLKVSRDSKSGILDSERTMIGPLTEGAQQLENAINDGSITSTIRTTDGNFTEDGHYMIGGAFSGADAKPLPGPIQGSTVQTFQDVNPNVLGEVDNYFGTPGSMTLHEVTESYEAGRIAQDSGTSIGRADAAALSNPQSPYMKAHNAATHQHSIEQRFFDRAGNITTDANKAMRAEFFVKQGNKPEKVIQRL